RWHVSARWRRSNGVVAVSPLSAVGVKPTRQHRIRARSRRSQQSQFPALGGRGNFEEARLWLRGSKQRVKPTCERGCHPGENGLRLKTTVALSPLGASGVKPTHERHIRLRSQRSERLQFPLAN